MDTNITLRGRNMSVCQNPFHTWHTRAISLNSEMKMSDLDKLYERYKTVYDIESREGKYGLEELHMLSDLTKEQFVERVKTDGRFAEKWGDVRDLTE